MCELLNEKAFLNLHFRSRLFNGMSTRAGIQSRISVLYGGTNYLVICDSKGYRAPYLDDKK